MWAAASGEGVCPRHRAERLPGCLLPCPVLRSGEQTSRLLGAPWLCAAARRAALASRFINCVKLRARPAHPSWSREPSGC